MSLGSISSFAEALGERVISFDFAPPVADVYATTRSRSSETDQQVAYPVFILKENGDILYFNHRLLQTRFASCLKRTAPSIQWLSFSCFTLQQQWH